MSAAFNLFNRLSILFIVAYHDKVPQAPRDDGVVVERHVERDHAGGDADAAQVRGHLVPDPEGALSEPLADGELQQEEREALGEQHDPVRDEEGA